MAGTWQRLAHAELGSGGDTIDTGTFTAKENLKVIGFIKATTTVRTQFQFNSDTGSNYANRNSANGGSDSTNTSVGRMYLNDLDRSSDCYFEANITNKSDKEKLVIYHDNWQDATGAGTAPMRTETTGKWANTSAQITSIQLLNDRAGDFASGSYITVFGASGDVITDEKTTITNVPAGTRYEETDTRKIYRRVSSETIWQQNATLNGGEQTVNQSGWQNYNAFKVPSSLAGKKVKSVVVKCWGQGGDQSPSGTISAHIYNGTTKKAESDTINTSTLATGSNIWDSATTCTFTGGTLSDYTLQTDDYVAVVGNTARTGGGYIQTASSDSQGSGTNRWYRTGGGSWTEDTNNTMYMTVTSTDDWKERGTA